MAIIGFKAFSCFFYAFIAISQTLTNRYIFKTLDFKFYSTVFLIQRIAILAWGGFQVVDRKTLYYVIPYAILTGTVNILSSYCMTAMPLAAFMAFKKFVPVFTIIVAIIIRIPIDITKIQKLCLIFIIVGGFLIGQRDMKNGKIIGYLASLLYTLLQAVGLQYAAYLYQEYQIQPRNLMHANSVLSTPYFLISALISKQFQGIYNYFDTRQLNYYLFQAFFLSIPLGLASQYTANIISMKVSPFDKASVSNVKDLILTLISAFYFKDITLSVTSYIGLIICLTGSVVFSLSLSNKPKNQLTEQQLQAI